MVNIIESNLEKIKLLCAKHKVKKLFVFGSVLTHSFQEKSDIDFIVDFDSIALEKYADNYFDLKEAFEKLFHRPIDLLEEKGIRNPYFKAEVERQRQLIYGSFNQNLAV